MDLILECGTQAIDAQVSALAAQLTEGLSEQGLAVVRAPGARIANIVCIGLGSDAEAAARLQDHLKSRNVQAAVRRKLLRFSIHLYNDASDIAAALEATRSWATKQGGGR
jgi:selenocysteine lyase/cysteine desulfurase